MAKLACLLNEMTGFQVMRDYRRPSHGIGHPSFSLDWGTQTVVHGKVNHNCIKQPGHSDTIEDFGPVLGACITCRSGQTKDRDTHTHSLQLHVTNNVWELPTDPHQLNTKQAPGKSITRAHEHKAPLHTI